MDAFSKLWLETVLSHQLHGIHSLVPLALAKAHLDKGLKADGIFWADYGESLGEKFNEWLLQ